MCSSRHITVLVAVASHASVATNLLVWKLSEEDYFARGLRAIALVSLWTMSVFVATRVIALQLRRVKRRLNMFSVKF